MNEKKKNNKGSGMGSKKEEKEARLKEIGIRILSESGSYEKAKKKMLECIKEEQWEEVFGLWGQGVLPDDSLPLQSLVRRKEVPKVLEYWHNSGGQLDDGNGVLLFHCALENKVKNVTKLIELLPEGQWGRAAYLGVLNLISGNRWSDDEKSWKIASMCLPYVSEDNLRLILDMAKKITQLRGDRIGSGVNGEGYFERLEQMVLEQKIEDKKAKISVEQMDEKEVKGVVGARRVRL